ncbi:MAG: response regulator [Gammaproteobacteria bacterium]|nr:response regulator [Gammaproteobacteria bacterium]
MNNNKTKISSFFVISASLITLSLLLFAFITYLLYQSVQGYNKYKQLDIDNRLISSLLSSTQDLIMERGRGVIALARLNMMQSKKKKMHQASHHQPSHQMNAIDGKHAMMNHIKPPSDNVSKHGHVSQKNYLHFRGKSNQSFKEFSFLFKQFKFDEQMQANFDALLRLRGAFVTTQNQIDITLNNKNDTTGSTKNLTINEWIQNANTVINKQKYFVYLFLSEFNVSAQFMLIQNVQRYALEISNLFGLVAPVFSDLLMNNKPLSAELSKDIRTRVNLMDYYWEQLLTETQLVKNKQLINTTHQTYKVYQEIFKAAIVKLLESDSGKILAITQPEYFKIASKTHKSFHQLMNLSVQSMQDYLQPLKQDHLNEIFIILIISSFVIVMVISVWLYIFSQIFYPWKLVITAMKKLSKLETDINIEHTSKSKELSDMANALEIFKTNSIMLSAATKKAKKADEAKSIFLANMSHEIRTPLNAIIGFTHILQRHDNISREEQQDRYNKISESAKHLLGVINNILDFSKIEAGKLQLENKDFMLEEVCKNVYTIVSEKVQEKQIEAIINIAPEIPAMLTGDSLRLGQVLINLVNNAVKYTDNGTVSINVKLLNKSKQDIKLLFSVEDTGIGLSNEEQQKLFKAFEQADVSTTRKYGGTGLGLIISQKIINLMKGDIGVKSEKGKGSTFWFTAYFNKSDSQSYQLKNLSNFGKQRILVVDDVEEARYVHKEILEHMMMRVDTAPDGETAIEMVKQSIENNDPYCTLIIDWSMPGIDGIETSRRIRELPESCESSHIIVTANNELSLEKFKQDRINAVLHKPVTPSLLFDTIIKSHYNFDDLINNSTINSKQVPDWSTQELDILVVEDNRLNQEVITDVLQTVGLNVIIANNGQEAIEQLKIQQPALVFMDIQMPVLDGIEATKQIRQFISSDELCIIAMTANAFTEDKENCFSAGMNEHISKPIEPNILFTMLLKWLPEPEQKQQTITATKNNLKSSLSKISVLNVDQAIIYFQGNYEKYLGELQRYYKQHQKQINLLGNHISNNDADAVRIAHTLKSSTKTLGIDSVHKIAEQLEISLKNKSSDVKQLFDKLVEQQNHVIEQLDQNLPHSEQARETETIEINLSEAKEKLLQLQQLLQNDDFSANDYFHEHLPLFSSAYKDQIDELQEHIENFDFDSAVALISQINLELISSEK